jgi:hypothetical protein
MGMTTPTRPPRESERLPESLAKSLLARASELDANSAAVSELRAAALEAGISNAAFEAALAEYRQGGQVAKPATLLDEPPVSRRRGVMAAAVAMIAAVALFAVMRVVPSQVQVVDPFQTRIDLACMNPQTAREMALTVLDLKTSTVSTNGNSLTISAPTQEQLDRVRNLIREREQAMCTVPTPPPTTTPGPPGR